MKKKTPFLDFYYKYAPDEHGDKKLPDYGLCCSLVFTDDIKEIFRLITPEGEVGFGKRDHTIEFKNTAWGCIDEDFDKSWYFNHFRQNVILLCAAINGEL